MSKNPRINASEAEKILLENGFKLIRTKGSHRIYLKNNNRIVIPFHGRKTLHPKIVQQVIKAIE